MDRREKSQRHFLEAQIRDIEKFKWLESEKAGKDIGWEEAARSYCRLHASGFRHKFVCDDLEEALLKMEKLKSKLNDEEQKILVDICIELIGEVDDLYPPR